MRSEVRLLCDGSQQLDSGIDAIELALTRLAYVPTVGYRVYQRSFNASAVNALIYDGSADATKTQLVVTNLVASAGYIFTVVAINEFNRSSSDADNVVALARLEPTVPSTVRDVSATAVTGGAIQLAYSSVLDTGGFATEVLVYYARTRSLAPCYSTTTACGACTSVVYTDVIVTQLASPTGGCSPQPCSSSTCCVDTSGRQCGTVGNATVLCAPTSPGACELGGLNHTTDYFVSMAASNPIGNSSYSNEVLLRTRCVAASFNIRRL